MESNNGSGNQRNATELTRLVALCETQNVPLTCLGWCSNEEIYYSDNHRIYKRNASTYKAEVVAILPNDFVPSDMHWLLMGGMPNAEGMGSDTLLICSRDGRYITLNKNAHVVYAISAHYGAITSGRWSPDGASILTAGVDGAIKIWSRLGVLESTVVHAEEAITCARWSSNSDSIVFCQGSHISVKALAANGKRIKWYAHEGMILSLSWSSQSPLIASAGADKRFKMWNNQGVNMFTSSLHEHPLTMVSFTNEDDLLVGGFNMLKLCSIAGGCYNTNYFYKPKVGTVLSASWSPDGNQVSCGTFNGHLVIGHLVKYPINYY